MLTNFNWDEAKKIKMADKLMQRASIWLNLYGCQAVQRELKKRVKNAFFVFLALFLAHSP